MLEIIQSFGVELRVFGSEIESEKRVCVVVGNRVPKLPICSRMFTKIQECSYLRFGTAKLGSRT